MTDSTATKAGLRKSHPSLIFGVSMGVLTLAAMFGVESLGEPGPVLSIAGILIIACDLVSVLGLPGLIVSLMASPFIGNMHDPNIYLAAAANALFYGVMSHWIREIRSRNRVRNTT